MTQKKKLKLAMCRGKRPSNNTTEQQQQMDDVVHHQATRINFQEEIIMEILSRLPVQSVHRFKCVSKFWKALISDPYFKLNHLNHAKNDQNSQKFLVIQMCIDKDDVFNFYSSSLSPVQLVEDEQKLDFPSSYKPLGCRTYCCCDGLVLLAVLDGIDEHLLLWNPSTIELIVLPRPEPPLMDCICGLGYDTAGGDYKILLIDLDGEHHRKVSIEV